MEICIVNNCMDGRVQLPVLNFLTEGFNPQYVDIVILFLQNRLNRSRLVEFINNRVDLTLPHHDAAGMSIVVILPALVESVGPLGAV